MERQPIPGMPVWVRMHNCKTVNDVSMVKKSAAPEEEQEQYKENHSFASMKRITQYTGSS